MFEQDSIRSVSAFGQYFTMNKFIREGIWPEDPWTNWEKYFYPVFGEVTTFSDIIKNNPTAFAEQLIFNLTNFLNKIYSSLGELISPQWFFKFKIVLATPFAVVIIALAIKFKSFINIIKKIGIKNCIINMIPFIAYLLPIIISCIILFPREHYFYMFNILIIVLFAIFFQLIINSYHIMLKPIYIYSYIGIICLYLFIINISLKNYYPNSTLSNKKTIDFLATLSIKKQVSILENEGGIGIFMPYNNYRTIFSWLKNESFNEFNNKFSFNMIWVTDQLLNDSRINSDPEWQSFLSTYEVNGFKRYDSEGIKGYLLIKKDLLP